MSTWKDETGYRIIILPPVDINHKASRLVSLQGSCTTVSGMPASLMLVISRKKLAAIKEGSDQHVTT